MSQLHDSSRVEERRRCLEVLTRPYGPAPIESKTFWEVAGSLCPEPHDSTR